MSPINRMTVFSLVTWYGVVIADVCHCLASTKSATPKSGKNLSMLGWSKLLPLEANNTNPMQPSAEEEKLQKSNWTNLYNYNTGVAEPPYADSFDRTSEDEVRKPQISVKTSKRPPKDVNVYYKTGVGNEAPPHVTSQFVTRSKNGKTVYNNLNIAPGGGSNNIYQITVKYAQSAKERRKSEKMRRVAKAKRRIAISNRSKAKGDKSGQKQQQHGKFRRMLRT